MSHQRRQGHELSVRTQLGLDIMVGSVARLALALVTSYRKLDAGDLAAWAQTMHDHPLAEFYAYARRPDHLPGDLWLLKALQGGYSALGGGDFGSSAFELLTNLVPVAADVLVGMLLFRIVLTWGSEQSALRTARWYLLNPGIIVLAGAWGQWDAVSIAVLLAGLLLMLSTGPAWFGSVPLMTWAVLMKPLLAIPAFAMLVWLALRASQDEHGRSEIPGRKEAGRFCAIAGAAIIAAVAVLQPFAVGLAWVPAGGSSLTQRLEYAAELHPYTTAGAANIWLVADRRVFGPVDNVPRWGHLSALDLGTGLAVALLCVIAVFAWRARSRSLDPESLLWACGAAVFASCLALTRIHERYYFPALVLLHLWASARGFDRRASAWISTFSALFVVDLVLPMGWTGHDTRPLHQPAALVVVGLAHVVLFVALIVLRPRVDRSREITADAPSAATVARRTAPG